MRGSVTLLQRRLSTHWTAGVKERHTLSFLRLIAVRLPGGVYLWEEPQDPHERSRRQSEAWLHWRDVRLFSQRREVKEVGSHVGRLCAMRSFKGQTVFDLVDGSADNRSKSHRAYVVGMIDLH
jgi:hypothetical protein